MREVQIERLPQLRTNGSVYDVRREKSGRGFWYTITPHVEISDKPVGVNQLPEEIYLFQVYGNNGSREVKAFITPSSREDIREKLKKILEACNKKVPDCSRCSGGC